MADDSGFSPSVEVESSGHVVVGGTVSSAKRLTVRDVSSKKKDKKATQGKRHLLDHRTHVASHDVEKSVNGMGCATTEKTRNEWKMENIEKNSSRKRAKLCCAVIFGQVL